MRVKNRKTIRHLSVRTFRACGKRNFIAVIAVALTAVLFTSLFTIAMSLNASYQTNTFREIGGCAHGSFKDVTKEQAEEIAKHRKVKASGIRVVTGTKSDGGFAKTPAEISYMDSFMTEWSYIDLEEGHPPSQENEMIMDTKALELLGVEPEIGAEIVLDYQITDKTQTGGNRRDTFFLSGWWEYDPVMPVHYINVSEEYVRNLEEEMTESGMEPFRADLNVMLYSSLNIEDTFQKIEEDIGLQNTDDTKDNYVRYGINWGYTAAQTASEMDPGLLAAIAAFVILVVLTGYLIIYNIFQISVAGDIRYYGLLKTIGVTPRQLKRIIWQQAALLCVIGCPLGLAGGWGIGALLVPVVIARTTLGEMSASVSCSPVLFAVSALFSVATVFLSCSRPGRMASRVSPVEAVKYTEVERVSRKERKTRGTGILRMAFANLGRSKKKTVLVVISLSLSVVLLSVTFLFTGSFSMEKYLAEKNCADFVVGNTDYFRFNVYSTQSGISAEDVEKIRENTEAESGGQAWAAAGENPQAMLTEDQFRGTAYGATEEELRRRIEYLGKQDDMIPTGIQIEGMDDQVLDKLTVLEGSLDPLKDPEEKAIAVAVPVDDYGTPQETSSYPKPGDRLTVKYVDEAYYIDAATGEKITESTPEENIAYHIEKSHDVEYTVCALVTIPYQISFRQMAMYGFDAVVSTERLSEDSGKELYSLFYMFDTPDREAEKEAEEYLAEMTEDDLSELMYESKEITRNDFQNFRQMFLLLGGILCAIVSVVGILNFFNAILTGILSRRREFAMLQSIGMTGKQLKKMLVMEGILYSAATILVSILLMILMEPLVGKVLASMFWFFEYRFSAAAVYVTAPVFLVFGVILPLAVYRQISKQTIVDRLREAE